MIKPVPNIASMSPYQLATLDSAYISLAQNESAYPPSPKAIEAASVALASAYLYSDPDWTILRAAIVDVHRIDSQQIICCLLYTSPSPRDRQKSRMPSSA